MQVRKTVVCAGFLLAFAAGGGLGLWSVQKERVWMASARATAEKVDPERVEGFYYVDLADLQRQLDRETPVDVNRMKNLGYYYKSLEHRSPEVERTIFRIFKKMSDQGDVPAMCELANLYLRGQGTPTNLVESTAWYGRVHAATNCFGTYGLAHAYHHGLGVPVDVPRAVELYKEAERRGVGGGAAYELGEIYERGLLGKVDIPEAIRWHRRSLQAKSNKFGHRGMSEAALRRLEGKGGQGR